MDRLIRDKWCAKLRDPNTKQTTKSLINEKGQCCLGVLSEVMGVDISPRHTRGYDYTEWTEAINDEGKRNLSAETVAECEDEELPPIAFAESIGLTLEDMTTLARMNDGITGATKKTFHQIASYIEENY